MPGVAAGAVAVGLMRAVQYVTTISSVDSLMIEGGEYDVIATTNAPDGTVATCTINGEAFDSGVTVSGGTATFTDTVSATMSAGLSTTVEVAIGSSSAQTTTTVFTAMAIGSAFISSPAYEGSATESISRVTSAALPANTFGLVWFCGDNLNGQPDGVSSRIQSVTVGGISAVKLAEYTNQIAGANQGGTLWVGWVKSTEQIDSGAEVLITTGNGEGMDACTVGGCAVECHADAVLAVDGSTYEILNTGEHSPLTVTMSEDTEHVLCRIASFHRSGRAILTGTVGWTLRGYDDYLTPNPTQDTAESVAAELLYDGFADGVSDTSECTRGTIGAKTSFMFALMQS